jgi:hypothetical protein
LRLVGGREGEILAAQQGLIADSLAHAAREDDRIMGQMIRTSVAAKMGTAVIRASGLRLWTAKLRAAFGLGWMAPWSAAPPPASDNTLGPLLRGPIGATPTSATAARPTKRNRAVRRPAS